MPRPLCALVVGHTPDAPGAVSVADVTEFAFNSSLAPAVADAVTACDVQIVYRGRPNDYWGLPRKVNATGADFAIELHFNAASPAAHGTETLYASTSQAGMALAMVVHQEVLSALALRDRGIRPRTPEDRGGRFLWGTVMPAVIAEPFFGSNEVDWVRAISLREGLIRAYAHAIDRYALATRPDYRGLLAGPAVAPPPYG